MTGPVMMTFDASGPAGVAGALRSAAASSPQVTLAPLTALRIARQMEAGEALYLALMDLRDRNDAAQRRVLLWQFLALAGFLCAVLP